MKTNVPYVTKKREICTSYNHWIDFLSIWIYQPLSIWNNLNLDSNNSNYSHINWEYFTYTQTLSITSTTVDLYFSLSIDDISYPIGVLKKDINPNPLAKGYLWKLQLFGTLFRLFEMNLIPWIYEVVHDIFWNEDFLVLWEGVLSRMDYKVDFMFKSYQPLFNPELVLQWKLGRYSSYKNYYKTDENWLTLTEAKKAISKIESHDDDNLRLSRFVHDGKENGRICWSPKNKTLLVRCYNKLLDCIQKNKIYLYSDYFWYESVYRLEAEFKTKTLKNSKGESLTFNDLDECELLWTSFFWIERTRKKYVYQQNNEVLTITPKYYNETKRRLVNIHNNWNNLYSLVNDVYLNDLQLSKEIVIEKQTQANTEYNLII